METSYGDFSEIVRDSACSMLNDPGVLSDVVIGKALQRRHEGTIGIQDAREFIEDYLRVLCRSRQG